MISEKVLDIDTEALLTRYSTDVIATCAFGVKTNSIQDKENEFYKMVKKVTTFDLRQVFILFIQSAIPIINKVIIMFCNKFMYNNS